MKKAPLNLTPADFATLPKIEDVCNSIDAGKVCVSLDTGEDISAAPDAVTVFYTPEGLPAVVDIVGQFYRLPEDKARLFAWGLQGPEHARAASAVSAGLYRLDLLENFAAHDLPMITATAARHLLEALAHWPEDTDPTGTGPRPNVSLTRQSARAALEAIDTLEARRGRPAPYAPFSSSPEETEDPPRYEKPDIKLF